MGNQEKAEKGDTVLATSTRLFQGRVVEDSDVKKENLYWLLLQL
jgi:aconitate hydratase 2/2-methylisocitrate dehydratase